METLDVGLGERVLPKHRRVVRDARQYRQPLPQKRLRSKVRTALILGSGPIYFSGTSILSQSTMAVDSPSTFSA